MTIETKFSIIENNKKYSNITYNSLVKNLLFKIKQKNLNNNSDFYQLENEYESFSLTELIHIYNYYNLKNKFKEKNELISIILLFELNSDNIDIVCNRKKLWNYINNIKKDEYLSQYLII